MAIVKVTGSGGVPLPSEIRDALGLQAGDVLDVRLRPEGVVELRRAEAPVRQTGRSILHLAGSLTPTRGGVTLDEMDQAIAEGAAGTGLGPRR